MKNILTLYCALSVSVASVGQAAETVGPIEQLDDTTVIAEDQRIEVETSRNSKLLTTLDETPRSIDIITRKQIEERGAQSVQQAIDYTTGVYTGPFGVDSRRDSANIRGVTHPVLMRDGLRYNSSFDNTVRPDAYMLESVSVVKGPASVLYGQGAVGGIINSTSKLPQAETKRELNFQYGSFDRFQVGFDFTGAISEDETLLFRAVGLYRDSGTQVDYVNDDAFIFMPSFTWAPTKDTSLTILANFQENKGGFTTQFLPSSDPLAAAFGVDINPSSSTFVGEPGYDQYNSSETSLSLLFDHKINDIFSFSTNIRRSEGSTEQNYMQVISPSTVAAFNSSFSALGYSPLTGPLSPVVNGNEFNRVGYARKQSLDLWAANALLRAEFDTGKINHRLQFGVDWLEANRESRRPEALVADLTNVGFGQTIWTNGFFLPDGTTAGPFGTQVPAASQAPINVNNPQYGDKITAPDLTVSWTNRLSQYGFILNDVITYNKWIASLGVRHDRVKELAYYRPDTNATVSAFTYDLGLLYQFDNGLNPYYSYSESFVPNGFDAITGDHLDPLTGNQHEIGLKYAPRGSNTLVTLSAFHIKQENRTLNPINPLFGFGPEQIDVTTKGIEFDVKHRVHDFYLQAGVSLLDATNETNGGDLKAPYVPEQMANAWVTYAPSSGKLKDFRSGLGARYAGRAYSRDNSLASDDPVLFDAMLGYRWKAIDFQLNVTNLLDKEYTAYTESQSPVPGATANFGARRSVILSANYSF